jgi:anti-anti-sigma factor
MSRFCKEWCNRLKLVADELFMNAVKYGSTKDKSVVYITFLYDEDEIQLTIEDDGTGADPISAEKLQEIIHKNEKNMDVSRTSGRGLSMITKLWTDDMALTKSEHGGISVSVRKKAETASAAENVQPSGLVGQAVSQMSAPNKSAEKPLPPESHENPQTYEVKLSGEIDQTNIDEIVAPINYKVHSMPAGSVLLLDFTDAKYINSMFIGNLAAWHTSLMHKGGHVQLKNMSPQIEEVLGLVGLLEVLENTQ